MADPVQQIAERVAEIAKKVATETSPVRIGTVLSVNPDGSVNVDDGAGGCARVANVGNQVVTCGSTIVLGLEPQVGQTTDLCQVQFTIDASGKDCPVEDRTDDNEVTDPVPLVTGFVDNRGRRYDLTTGAYLATGAETADVDAAFGYDSLFDDFYAGATPLYQDLIIGTDTGVSGSGYQGEPYAANNTVLCRGVGAAVGVLCGAEIENLPGGGHVFVWTINLRDATTYALLASDSATYIQDWMTAHASEYPGDNTSYDVNISADPSGDSFWVGIGGNNNANQLLAWVAPVFQISAADASLMATVELQIPPKDIAEDFFRRANRFTA